MKKDKEHQARHKALIKSLPFHNVTISGRTVEVNVEHNSKFTSTMLIKCNGRMKEMFEDKGFIRSIGRFAASSRAAYLQDHSVPDGNQ